jgi:hypothetical protein
MRHLNVVGIIDRETRQITCYLIPATPRVTFRQIAVSIAVGILSRSGLRLPKTVAESTLIFARPIIAWTCGRTYPADGTMTPPYNW